MRTATPRERRLLYRAIRAWRGPRLPDGLPRQRKLTPERFDPDQLAIGIGVEQEHTKRPELAMEIAMAHLSERRDYYDLLEKMEKSPKKRARGLRATDFRDARRSGRGRGRRT